MRWLAVVWLAAWAAFSVPWTTATSTPQWDRVRPPRIGPARRVRPDHVLNVIFYIPVAPLGVTLGWRLPVVMAAGGMLSMSAEALQLFSLGRSPDGNDIVANMAGTIAGAALVLLRRRRLFPGRRT